MSLQERVTTFNQTLKNKGITIFCAESITAGLLASSIASVSGASSVLMGSIVTYNANVKTNILKVSPLTVIDHTAESQETTDEMCLGLPKIYAGASLYVAVTGVASAPAADSDYVVNKEVGQIYVSILYKGFHKFSTIIDSKERNEIRDKTVAYILDRIEEVIAY